MTGEPIILPVSIFNNAIIKCGGIDFRSWKRMPMEFQPEIVEWCEDYGVNAKLYWAPSKAYSEACVIEFDSVTSAVAFKLRWLS